MSSEQDTFDKLRRVDYNIAFAEYMFISEELGCCASIEMRRHVAEATLSKLGWTLDELLKETYILYNSNEGGLFNE